MTPSTPTQDRAQAATGQAQEKAHEVKDQAQEVKDQAQEKVQEIAGQAQEQAQQAGRQVREQVRGQLDERSTAVGTQVKTAAGDLRNVADQLRKDERGQHADLAEQAADRVERLGGYLTEADADKMLRDIEDLARRQPLTVVLGGLAVGFAASRVLRASSADRHRTTKPTGDAGQPTGENNGSGTGRSLPMGPPVSAAGTSALEGGGAL